MRTYPLAEARNQLGKLVGRVRHGQEHILITAYGRPAAALIPVSELEELQRLQDDAWPRSVAGPGHARGRYPPPEAGGTALGP
ncbi:type II toxin-antitoxin system Phd/YefM family antitoxin [Streptomyces collinus]|uniref:type II toxin-antitoxin system Phd/YefM family antitoxin n=1 Tax=Streptomyces collinus TaxID=42684 RepID=UPI000996823C|nr:type II toxin-antitoxin system Phd/YefM family antitoxin [Streptomyces collinus]UJA16178.1 type II toxin-antitoxin system Phd/YefM family antitoxin [Streptomyces collinus]